MKNFLEKAEFGSLIRLHNGEQYVITSFSNTHDEIYGVLLNDHTDINNLESVNITKIMEQEKSRLYQIHSLFSPVSHEHFKYYYKELSMETSELGIRTNYYGGLETLMITEFEYQVLSNLPSDILNENSTLVFIPSEQVRHIPSDNEHIVAIKYQKENGNDGFVYLPLSNLFYEFANHEYAVEFEYNVEQLIQNFENGEVY